MTVQQSQLTCDIAPRMYRSGARKNLVVEVGFLFPERPSRPYQKGYAVLIVCTRRRVIGRHLC